MNLGERLARLEPRERRLLGILGGVFGAMAFLALPIGIAASVHSEASENASLRDAITSIDDARDAVAKQKSVREAVAQRYASPAPPIAPLLAKYAGEVQLGSIPESQDRQALPHGKRYSERATKITLRKVGMLKLVKFMEKVETSGHPLSLSSLNIRKRASEPDSYDVDMVVSAFDRKAAEPKKTTPSAAPSAGDDQKEPSE